jgi:hypothetical protein
MYEQILWAKDMKCGIAAILFSQLLSNTNIASWRKIKQHYDMHNWKECINAKQHKKLATHVTEGCLFLTFNKWKDNLLEIIYHKTKQNLTVIYVCITCRRAYYSSKRSQIYNVIIPGTARIATRNMKHSKKLINGSEKNLILWNYILNTWMNPVGSFQAPSNFEVEYLPWTTETMSGFKK